MSRESPASANSSLPQLVSARDAAVAPIAHDGDNRYLDVESLVGESDGVRTRVVTQYSAALQ